MLGLLLLAGVRGIAPGAGYDRIGPRFFPIVTATGMILLGAVLAISARRRRPPVESTPAAPSLNWMPFGYFALAFVLFIALLDPPGSPSRPPCSSGWSLVRFEAAGPRAMS